MEEAAESEASGTGAAAAAAAAALAAKEEGRRLDSLTVESVGALKEACAVYRDVCLTLKERTEVLEATHIAMLDAVREHYLARTEAEADAIREATGGDAITKLAEQLLPHVIGGLKNGHTKKPL
jgi:hypothetical protein